MGPPGSPRLKAAAQARNGGYTALPLGSPSSAVLSPSPSNRSQRLVVLTCLLVVTFLAASTYYLPANDDASPYRLSPNFLSANTPLDLTKTWSDLWQTEQDGWRLFSSVADLRKERGRSNEDSLGGEQVQGACLEMWVVEGKVCPELIHLGDEQFEGKQRLQNNGGAMLEKVEKVLRLAKRASRPKKTKAKTLRPADRKKTTLQVDILMTWVNGSDVILRTWKEGTVSKTGSGNAHFRSHNELLYSLRSLLAAFTPPAPTNPFLPPPPPVLPYLRRLHLLTLDLPTHSFPSTHPLHSTHSSSLARIGQIPRWLNSSFERESEGKGGIREMFSGGMRSEDGGPELVVRHHAECFEFERGGKRGSGQVDTPNFNSLGIESRMGHLDGMSDNVLYTNDDVFYLKPLNPLDIFSPLTGPVFRIQRDLLVKSSKLNWDSLRRRRPTLSSFFSHDHHLEDDEEADEFTTDTEDLEDPEIGDDDEEDDDEDGYAEAERYWARKEKRAAGSNPRLNRANRKAALDAEGEWPGLGNANALLDIRFGKRSRGYLSHVGKVLNVPVWKEALSVFEKELSPTTHSVFRGSTPLEVQTPFLVTHYHIERHRETLLYAYFYGVVDADHNLVVSIPEQNKILSDLRLAGLGLTSEDDEDKPKEDKLKVVMPRRNSLRELKGTLKRIWELDGPASTRFEWTSSDGYGMSFLGSTRSTKSFKPEPKGKAVLPSVNNVPSDEGGYPYTPTGGPRKYGCTISLNQCFGFGFGVLDGEMKLEALFKTIAYEKGTECGDCLIAALVGLSGPTGLKAFLPPVELGHQPHQDDFLPLPSTFAPFSFASSTASPLPLHHSLTVSKTHLRSFLVSQIHKYSYTIGSTRTRLIQMRNAGGVKEALTRADQEGIEMLACNDDVGERDVGGVDRVLKGWYEDHWAEKAGWEKDVIS